MSKTDTIIIVIVFSFAIVLVGGLTVVPAIEKADAQRICTFLPPDQQIEVCPGTGQPPTGIPPQHQGGPPTGIPPHGGPP